MSTDPDRYQGFLIPWCGTWASGSPRWWRAPPRTRRRLCELVDVTYGVLPAAFTVDAARRPGAPAMHADKAPVTVSRSRGNVAVDVHADTGDVDAAALAASAHVVELTTTLGAYRTPMFGGFPAANVYLGTTRDPTGPGDRSQ